MSIAFSLASMAWSWWYRNKEDKTEPSPDQLLSNSNQANPGPILIDSIVPSAKGYVPWDMQRPVMGQVWNRALAWDNWTKEMAEERERKDVLRYFYQYPTYDPEKPLQIDVMSLKKILPLNQPTNFEFLQDNGWSDQFALRLQKPRYEP
jgi:hypothetical protein